MLDMGRVQDNALAGSSDCVRRSTCIGLTKLCSHLPRNGRLLYLNTPFEWQHNCYFYTRVTPKDWPRPAGRIDAPLIAKGTWPSTLRPTSYVCGPTSFVEHATDLLIAAPTIAKESGQSAWAPLENENEFTSLRIYGWQRRCR